MSRILALLVAAIAAFCVLAGSASAAKPSLREGSEFTIEKLQRIAGEDQSFTTAELTAEVGQTVEYEIVVTNTSDSTLEFSALEDEECEGISPAGETELEAGESETFTCEELLTEPGLWSNEAEIESGEEWQISNTVSVEVPERPGLAVEKLQRIESSGDQFTTAELTGSIGETVEYEIVVANTGNVALSLTPLEDDNCTGISPDGETELEPGESEIFTCEHELTTPGQTWSNEATISSGEVSEDSNTVYVSTQEEPKFTIEKLQRIAGEDQSFTTAELTGSVGQTVEYEIVVENTSEVALSLSPLEDSNCTGISPGGETELEPGESETFTCEHALTAAGQFWSNEATISSGKVSKSSNLVYVFTQEEPEFTIEKSQRIADTESAFTTDELTAKLGQTVDYQIVLSNTGNRPLAFSKLEDTNCTNVSPAEETELDADESETFTCEHKLSTAGEWTNVAEITGRFSREEQPEAIHARAIAHNVAIKKVTSNKVVANVPAEPAFEVEKLQTIKGSGAGFTKGELTAAVGQTVEYEIVVHNAGNVPLALSPLADANCGGISPAGATELPIGESETFTCEHVLTGAGTYTNEASIEAAGKAVTSNKVTVQAVQQATSTGPAQVVAAKCTLSESLIVLHGVSGSKHTPFTAHISALGIKQITFYLDGHKLKTLTAAQASKGQFSVRIDPSKLHYGAHRVSVKTVMNDSACAAIARSALFVHPRPAKIKPKFTG